MTEKNPNNDIDSKIADFMADIDEIVLGKKSNNVNDHHEKSEWKQCYDETSQAVYYWNTKTNECSWEPPSSHLTGNSDELSLINSKKKRPQLTDDNNKSTKKMKRPALIAEYTSSESENSAEEEETVDDIDELLNKVLDKEEKVKHTDLYPSFEQDCLAAIARLGELSDKTPELFSLRIQLETRLEDCLSGHLSKSYAVSKLNQALIQIEQFEKLHSPSPSSPPVTEPIQPPLTTSEMALLLSLPPPPPPPSPPPSSSYPDETLQLFYAQLNCDQPEPLSSNFDVEKLSTATKSEQQHHHHQKDKKSKPAKTLPTDLIQKWTHARHELHGIADIDDS